MKIWKLKNAGVDMGSWIEEGMVVGFDTKMRCKHAPEVLWPLPDGRTKTKVPAKLVIFRKE